MGRKEGGRGEGMWAGKEARKGNFVIIGGGSVWFLACSSSIFLKVHEICNRLICNMSHYGKLHISSPGKTPGGLYCPELGGGGLRYVGFEHMVFIFFWKYITFAIDWHIIWPYLENLIFHVLLIFWIITNNSCSTILIFHSKIFNNHFLFVWEYYIGSY